MLGRSPWWAAGQGGLIAAYSSLMLLQVTKEHKASSVINGLLLPPQLQSSLSKLLAWNIHQCWEVSWVVGWWPPLRSRFDPLQDEAGCIRRHLPEHFLKRDLSVVWFCFSQVCLQEPDYDAVTAAYRWTKPRLQSVLRWLPAMELSTELLTWLSQGSVQGSELVHTWVQVPWVLWVWTKLLTILWPLLLLCNLVSTMQVRVGSAWRNPMANAIDILECLSNFILSDNPCSPESVSSCDIQGCQKWNRSMCKCLLVYFLIAGLSEVSPKCCFYAINC